MEARRWINNILSVQMRADEVFNTLNMLIIEYDRDLRENWGIILRYE